MTEREKIQIRLKCASSCSMTSKTFDSYCEIKETIQGLSTYEFQGLSVKVGS